MKYTKTQIDEALSYWKRQEKKFMLQEAIEAADLDKEVEKTDKEAQIAMNKLTVAQAVHDMASLAEPAVDAPVQTTDPELDEADVSEADVPMRSEEDFFGKIDDPINDVPPTEKKSEEKKPEDVPAARTDIDESVFDKLFGKDYAPNTVGAVIKLLKKAFKMEDRIVFTVRPDQKECIIIDVNRKGDKFAMVDLAFGQPE